MKHSIDHIIKESAKQNRSAQKDLYDYTYQALTSIIALYVKDNSERDWVFNLGMLRIYTSLSSFAIGTNYDGWARTILVRVAIDYIRSNTKNKVTLVAIDSAHEQIENDGVDDLLNQLEVDDLTKMIQALPENERLVFTLFEIEGYGHKEIASLTSINQNTSKWLLTKARTSLKMMVERTFKITKSKK